MCIFVQSHSGPIDMISNRDLFHQNEFMLYVSQKIQKYCNSRHTYRSTFQKLCCNISSFHGKCLPAPRPIPTCRLRSLIHVDIYHCCDAPRRITVLYVCILVGTNRPGTGRCCTQCRSQCRGWLPWTPPL